MNIDAVIIVVYFCGMLGCGILGMRLAKSREHFAVAGRTLNFWLYFPCLKIGRASCRERVYVLV